MKPVNLLPQSARPYETTGKGSGAAYVVIGVLTALVIAVAAYVLTTNKITTRNADISRARQETQAAQTKAAGLQKYGEFAQVASARTSAVGSLAEARIDYERLLRETSRVLPAGVWLTQLDAESTGSDSGSTPTPSTSSTTTTAPAGPTVHLLGCSPSQKSVATTLVRLRAIHGSGDVQLNDSGKPLPQGGGTSGSSAGGGDCGSHYSFDILVTLTPQITGFGDLGHKVPADLGGGS